MGVVPYLSEDILKQIFNRLPLKTLAHFKLTCKKWNTLISHPHLMHHTFNCELGGNNHLIFLESKTLKFSMYTIDYRNGNHLIYDNEASIRSLSPTTNTNTNNISKLPQSAFILGSYNGLVASIFNYQDYVLWNPLTGNYISVHGIGLHYGPYLSHLRVGLCYDVSCNEYTAIIAYNRLVVLVNFNPKQLHSDPYRWFQVPETPQVLRGVSTREVGKVVNGVPHWRMMEKEIIYFDLKEEKFKKIDGPDDGKLPYKRMVGLVAMDGERQLGVVLEDKLISSLEVWVMKEYKNLESWTNLFKISCSTMNKSIGDVLGFMATEEFLIGMGSKGLWEYDLQQGSFKQIHLWSFTLLGSIVEDIIITFQPSLTLPP